MATSACSTGSGCRCSRCSSFSLCQRWRRRTGRHSICPKRNPNWLPGFMVEYFLHAIPAIHAGRICRHRSDVCIDHDPVSGAGGCRHLDVAPFNWFPGVFWFVFKVVLVFFMFAMVKAIVPRYRYDQLMRLGWKVFLPLSLVHDRCRLPRSCISSIWRHEDKGRTSWLG